jgi:hypothetical protein
MISNSQGDCYGLVVALVIVRPVDRQLIGFEHILAVKLIQFFDLIPNTDQWKLRTAPSTTTNGLEELAQRLDRQQMSEH